MECFTEDDYGALQDQHYYAQFAEELRMLQKVNDYYRRHPEAERRPWYNSSSVTFPADDAEVVEYLKHHVFSLGPRRQFVCERLSYLRSSLRLVLCPSCKSGQLKLDAKHWEDPNTI